VVEQWCHFQKETVLQYNKVFMIREWKPYEEELIQMVKEFYDSNWKIYKELNFKIR